MTGQPYSVSVALELPESPVNLDAGMFMACLSMRSSQGEVVASECRATMLRYRSERLRIMETIVFAPALLSGKKQVHTVVELLLNKVKVKAHRERSFVLHLCIGYWSEKQWLEVEFFPSYSDDPLSPATHLELRLLSRRVEVYAAEFRVRARFSGLRRIMHDYPVASAVAGCSLNMAFLSAVVLLSYFRCDIFQMKPFD